MLRLINFKPSKAAADICVRPNNGLYEYIAVFVYDLLIAAKDPSDIIQTLKEQHKFSLKRASPLTYNLECDYFRDNNGSFCYGPTKYIYKIMG
jgi:hypothetical protein